MEAKVAEWSVACLFAIGAALILYGVVSAFADGESIREFAELNALVVAAGMGAISLKG